MKTGARIKVVGVGGSGCNAISRMAKCKVQGVELIALNCDAQDIKKTNAHKKIQIGKNLTRGLGAGMNPRIGKEAAEESRQIIETALEGGDIIFIVCGMGGGTGTGAAPIVAEIAQKTGALTIGAITLPFSFEGAQRRTIAKIGQRKIKNMVDTLFVIPNDKLLARIDEKTTFLSAFWICDEVLRQAVQGISDLIVRPGIINVDFADVKAVMSNSGNALFGVGTGEGDDKIVKAAEMAIHSSFLDFGIQGANRVLFNITGGKNLSLAEVQQAAKIITKNSSATRVIFGAIEDRKLKPNEVKITLIAAGIG
ncbi:cell division protein FtsZ [Patescibacteria group bacterium]|nr:cell division protein FtsZ [Patescibacteria group bacterium]MBU4162336.1 cell division protein FtsZ [Patescibacteria group bacterium]